MELQEYLNVIRRRWWILALLLLIGFAAVYSYTKYQVEPVYKASASLIVNKPNVSESGRQQINRDSIDTNLMLINTYKEILKSPAIMKLAAKAHPEFNLTANQMSRKVSVQSMKDTQIITISAEDASYPRAARIVNAVSNTFQAKVSGLMKINNGGTVSVLNGADPASAAVPVNANHQVMYLLVFVLALAIGLSVIFLLDYLDRSVRTEHDIEQLLGMKLLAKVPRIKKSHYTQLQSGAVPHTESTSMLRAAKEQR